MADIAIARDARLRANVHRLTRAQLMMLADGHGDAELVAYLWRTERSRRMLLVKTALDEGTRRPEVFGPLARADEVWEILTRIEAADPVNLDRVLLHPQVGTGLSYALRRLRGGAEAQVPLWVDFGQVHLLALVAAARAGIDWHCAVASRDGNVMLPGLGMVRLGATAETHQGTGLAHADTVGGRIRLRQASRTVEVPADPHRDGPGWWSLRQLRVGNVARLTVFLDDIDPFRDVADPVPPGRLADADVARWHALLDEAFAMLCRDQPEAMEALAAGVVSLVPLSPADGWLNRSASTGDAFGCVLSSPPQDATALAVILVHEFQHTKLGGLMHLVALTEEDADERFYAPWRDDPRPVHGLTQGSYAFFGIAEFWREHRHRCSGAAKRSATFEYRYALAQVREALDNIAASQLLTDLGAEFVGRLSQQVDVWRREETEPVVSALVDTAVACHRAGWRVRHQRPRPGEAEELAYGYLSGTARVAETARSSATTVVAKAHSQEHWSRARLELIRAQLLAGTAGANAEGPRGDAELVAGDMMAARDRYLERIAENPVDVDAWAGLAVATGSTGPPRAARVLLDRPDLAFAVYQLLRYAGRSTSPIELASWLAAGAS